MRLMSIRPETLKPGCFHKNYSPEDYRITDNILLHTITTSLVELISFKGLSKDVTKWLSPKFHFSYQVTLSKLINIDTAPEKQN